MRKEKSKKYKVEILFEQGKTFMKREVFVNGIKSPMPPRLEKWIAEEFVRELFSKSL